MWQNAKSTSNDMKRIATHFRAAACLWPGILLLAVFDAPCFAQAPITNGLIARWPGDGNAKDSAGHYDGVVSGGLRYAPGPAAAQAFYFGGGAGPGLYDQVQLPPVSYTIDSNGNVVFLKPDEDVRGGHPQPQLNGSGAQVDFGKSIGNFGTRDFTIAYWMKTDSTAREQAFLSKRAGCDGGSPFWSIRLGGPATPPGSPKLELCDPRRTTALYLFTSRPMNDGQWHHIVWVRQSTSSGSTTALVYVDGALDSSIPLADEMDFSNQAPLVLGQNVCQCCDGTRPYSGAAAELQIFSHALSAEEVLTLFKAGKPGK